MHTCTNALTLWSIDHVMCFQMTSSHKLIKRLSQAQVLGSSSQPNRSFKLWRHACASSQALHHSTLNCEEFYFFSRTSSALVFNDCFRPSVTDAHKQFQDCQVFCLSYYFWHQPVPRRCTAVFTFWRMTSTLLQSFCFNVVHFRLPQAQLVLSWSLGHLNVLQLLQPSSTDPLPNERQTRQHSVSQKIFCLCVQFT